jgi:hypothetical protein
VTKDFNDLTEEDYNTNIDWNSVPQNTILSEYADRVGMRRNSGGVIYILSGGLGGGNTLTEGGWFYFKVIDFKTSAHLYGINSYYNVKTDIYIPWYNNTQWDANGDPFYCDESASPVDDIDDVNNNTNNNTVCPPDHDDYTPYYEMNSRMTGGGVRCFDKPDSFQKLVEQALANDTDGDNELHLPWSSFPGVHSNCLSSSKSNAPRNYKIFVPPGTFYAGIDLAYTTTDPGDIKPVYPLHFKD